MYLNSIKSLVRKVNPYKPTVPTTQIRKVNPANPVTNPTLYSSKTAPVAPITPTATPTVHVTPKGVTSTVTPPAATTTAPVVKNPVTPVSMLVNSLATLANRTVAQKLNDIRDSESKPKEFTPGYFAAPRANVLSDVDALKQAQDQLNPALIQQRTNAADTYQQNINAIRQAMNAKNQLDSGGQIDRLMQNAGSLQKNLVDIDVNGQSQANQLAQQLRQLSMQQANDEFNRAIQGYQTNQNAYDSNRSFSEGQREFNIDAAKQLSALFGKTVQPTTSGKELFNQVNGMKTLDGQQLGETQRQFNINSALDVANAFGVPVTPTTSGKELFNQVAGVTPLSGQEMALNRTNADRDYAINQANLQLQRDNMNNDNALGWAGLDLDQQKLGLSSSSDIQNQIQDIRNSGLKMINGLSDKPSYDKNGKLVSPGFGPKTKSVMASEFNKLFAAYLNEDDPYAEFVKDKSKLYGDYSKKGYGSYLINALGTALSQTQGLGE